MSLPQNLLKKKQNAGLLSSTGQLHLRKPLQRLKISGEKEIHNRKNQPGENQPGV